MTGEVDIEILRSKCRVQDVKFDSRGGVGPRTETFVRIKTRVPGLEVPHFIMRKAEDDYISVTSMYRAVFYKSTLAQEKEEMEIVKRELAARLDTNASGLWIPGTPDALQLADVYGIRPWIEALLSAPTTRSDYGDEQRSPPSSQNGESTPIESVQATPSRKSTRERSRSPRKQLAASARKPKSSAQDIPSKIKEDVNGVLESVQSSTAPGIKKIKNLAQDISDTIQEDVNEVTESMRNTTAPSTKKIAKTAQDISKTLKEDGNGAIKSVQIPTSPSIKKVGKAISRPLKEALSSAEAGATKVSDYVAATADGLNGAEENSDEVKYTTTVASTGKSMSEIVAEARAQVEAAQEKDKLALSKSGLASPSKVNRKRALEVEDEHMKDQTVSIKRTRVEELEVGLIQERRKVRALFGLVIGLGATAILPYVL